MPETDPITQRILALRCLAAQPLNSETRLGIHTLTAAVLPATEIFEREQVLERIRTTPNEAHKIAAKAVAYDDIDARKLARLS